MHSQSHGSLIGLYLYAQKNPELLNKKKKKHSAKKEKRERARHTQVGGD
jgi:hypothetical protein